MIRIRDSKIGKFNLIKIRVSYGRFLSTCYVVVAVLIGVRTVIYVIQNICKKEKT